MKVPVISTLTILLSMSTRTPGDLDSSAAQINKTIANLKDYSNSRNLALNLTKANWMLISTPQMARYHSLKEQDLPIFCRDSALQRTSSTKLLGVHGSTPLMEHTHGFSIKFVIWDSIRSVEAQTPYALPHQETSCKEPSSITPKQCLQSISSLACLSRKVSPTSTECAGFVTRKFAGLKDSIKLNC